MKKMFALFLALIMFPVFAEEIDLNFKNVIDRVPEEVNSLPVHDRGRFKPFQTYAREKMLYISGKYSPLGQNAHKMYLALIVSPEMTSQTLPIINIRSVKVRKLLGFSTDQRYVSLKALSGTRLEAIASPLIARERENARSLSADDKELLELFGQYWTMQGVVTGKDFFDALSIKGHGADGDVQEEALLGTNFLKALSSGENSRIMESLRALNERLSSTMNNIEGEGAISKIPVEIIYNKKRPFFVAALLFFAIFFASFTAKGKDFLLGNRTRWATFVPVLLLLAGLTVRIFITGFAPVTNMYGTMIWVAFGMALFSTILHVLYKNLIILRVSWFTAAVFLLLTESIPLTLSPDLDPIVAVLRSNMWLTLHVLTIVISYSAFTIAMMLGNYVLIQGALGKNEDEINVKAISHYIYRLVQLGVFLITAGIILGGVWADYSWGRFWGWDPKETCALIADIGYLILLHGRFAGWVTPYRMAFLAPIAYFLVVFAWYGVNFILATGLHSYGFSSGGVTVVVTYVIVQLLLLGLALLRRPKALTEERGIV